MYSSGMFIAGEWVESQSGKTHKLVADGDVPMAADQLRYFGSRARMLSGAAAAEYLPGYTSWLHREPVEVVAQVTPWNYPIMMAVWKIGGFKQSGFGKDMSVQSLEDYTVTKHVMAELTGEARKDWYYVVLGDE